mmetsp:Transcript_74754/g.216998  ORF Transcript_74754/g.216998 Transcript_74754/m.216998 type:complete len:270 (-) Transcript_74754:576-1385(-)
MTTTAATSGRAATAPKPRFPPPALLTATGPAPEVPNPTEAPTSCFLGSQLAVSQAAMPLAVMEAAHNALHLLEAWPAERTVTAERLCCTCPRCSAGSIHVRRRWAPAAVAPIACRRPDSLRRRPRLLRTRNAARPERRPLRLRCHRKGAPCPAIDRGALGLEVDRRAFGEPALRRSARATRRASRLLGWTLKLSCCCMWHRQTPKNATCRSPTATTYPRSRATTRMTSCMPATARRALCDPRDCPHPRGRPGAYLPRDRREHQDPTASA